MAQGSRFEVQIEKARGIHGEQVKPFEARLETSDDITGMGPKLRRPE
jgi:hypothetical protein